MGKSYKYMYNLPLHVSVILIIIDLPTTHLLLFCNNTFMTDSMYLGTTQICRNVNKHYHYLISATLVIWQMTQIVYHSSH